MITHVNLGIDDQSGSFIYLYWLAFYFSFSIFFPQWDDETGKVMRFCLKVNRAIKIQILILILLSLCISYRSRWKKLVSLGNWTPERRGRQNACVWQTWRAYYFCVLWWSSLKSKMFSGLVQKDLLKGGWSSMKKFFKQSYCHTCHTRFAVFFPLPSCCEAHYCWSINEIN